MPAGVDARDTEEGNAQVTKANRHVCLHRLCSGCAQAVEAGGCPLPSLLTYIDFALDLCKHGAGRP
eukprot:1160384-Pelagomonas_calceolata.AAC.2